MKRGNFFAVIMLLLAFVVQGQQPFNPFTAEVNLPADSITKADLLDSISNTLNIYFSYNPELLNAREKVKLPVEKATLLTILTQLTDPEIIRFHLLDNQVVFYPAKREAIDSTLISQKKFVTIRGSVFDRKEGEPIPFCNIALIGKGLGAMSNNDGNFSVKIPIAYLNDTLQFSCLGFKPVEIVVASAVDSLLQIMLDKTVFHLKTIEVVHYQPAVLLQKYFDNLDRNYESEYTLLTSFYREIILENNQYADVSEAVLNVLKAPYTSELREDMVKFVKGRKSSNVQPFDEIRFKLRGGPYYITKLDVVKNQETFINPGFIHLFEYRFERKTLIGGRETAAVSFSPVYNLRDLLYEGVIFFDLETGAISRVEFNYTGPGLKEARRLMIEREPRDSKAVPTELAYNVQYTYVDGKWYLHAAQSSMQIKIINKEKKQRTLFSSISEILITNIEKGDLQYFSRRDIFRPNEFFTERISDYDVSFWENYNVIEPEEAMENAIKNFDDHKQIIMN
jgi:hypothetical protein